MIRLAEVTALPVRHIAGLTTGTSMDHLGVGRRTPPAAAATGGIPAERVVAR